VLVFLPFFLPRILFSQFSAVCPPILLDFKSDLESFALLLFRDESHFLFVLPHSVCQGCYFPRNASELFASPYAFALASFPGVLFLFLCISARPYDSLPLFLISAKLRISFLENVEGGASAV